MRKSFGLLGFALCLVLAEGRAGRGSLALPCESCACANAQAWGVTGYNGTDVLMTVDPDDPGKLGTVVSTAKWAHTSGSTSFGVYSAICLQDYHDTIEGQYKKWTFAADWQNKCTFDTTGGITYYIAREYTAGVNPTGVPYVRNSCGTQ